MWLAVLSDQLRIRALVGHDPTNQLIRRRPLRQLRKAFPRLPLWRRTYAVLAAVSRGYPPLPGRSPTCYSPVRHWRPKPPVRLACLRCAASVCPEPGSNSPSQLRSPHRGSRPVLKYVSTLLALTRTSPSQGHIPGSMSLVLQLLRSQPPRIPRGATDMISRMQPYVKRKFANP